MMRSKPRKEDPKINMVLRSDITTRADRRNLGDGKETYLEARETSQRSLP